MSDAIRPWWKDRTTAGHVLPEQDGDYLDINGDRWRRIAGEWACITYPKNTDPLWAGPFTPAPEGSDS